jgi:uncharacterized protein (DUF433 family)
MTYGLQEYGEECVSPGYQKEWGLPQPPPFVRDLKEEVKRITEGSSEFGAEYNADVEPIEEQPIIDEETIIDRGRGPELVGTRVTVYLIMDFLKYNYPASEIARELAITTQQVRAALDYIEEHRTQVDADYERILERVNRPNAPEVEAFLPKTSDELRRRIMERHIGKGDHDRPVGQ